MPGPISPLSPPAKPDPPKDQKSISQNVMDPKLRQQIAARVAYYRELGIYDFYRREGVPKLSVPQSIVRENAQNTEAAASSGRMGEKISAEVASTSSVKNRAESNAGVQTVRDPVAELKAIREDIGECTRCILHKGRKQIVFGVGNSSAELMFIGEAPGADEDQQGLPFVGRAGQLRAKTFTLRTLLSAARRAIAPPSARNAKPARHF
jgi:uracil-DNA glycosylase